MQRNTDRPIDERVRLLDLTALSNDRLAFADTIGELAINFIVFHELAHIVRGHLDWPSGGKRYFRITDGSDPFERTAVTTVDESVYYHAIEMDADISGSRVFTQYPRANERFAFLIGSSLALFYAIITPVCRISEYESPSHPHPLVRLEGIKEIMAREVDETYIELLMERFLQSDIALLSSRMPSVFSHMLILDVLEKDRSIDMQAKAKSLYDQVIGQYALYVEPARQQLSAFKRPFSDIFPDLFPDLA